MKIVMMNGGLSNQTFQYLFGQLLAKISGDQVIYDDSFFDSLDKNIVHTNKSSIKRRMKGVFNIDYPKLKDSFSDDVWGNIISLNKKGKSTATILLENGYNFDYIYETNDYSYSGVAIKFNGTIAKNKNEYYWGYWISKQIFDQSQIQLKLNVPEALVSSQLANEIQANDSVAVHIRRFSKEGYNWDLPSSYYMDSVNKTKMHIKYPKFFIFSDDIEWCLENKISLGLVGERICFIDDHSNEDINYYDMYLLSLAKNLIMSNSSFSYLAALLNNNKKIVINPTPGRAI